ncbi:MAG: LD-carboxypeptidase, partial [Acetoanaerobium sp.]|nr:LD-carboxypeptidase [Acetoanaerobium sp.]
FKDIPEVTENSFLDAYTKPGKEYNILSYDDDYSVVNAGKSEGEITGGNLSLIVASLGTEYEINTDGKILFIEEIGEHTYRVDRMLQQLRLAGKLKNIKGIIIGDFNKVNKEAIEDMSLDDVFKENFKDLDIPIIEGVNSGHVRPFITIPIGANATIDTSKNEIIVKNIVK